MEVSETNLDTNVWDKDEIAEIQEEKRQAIATAVANGDEDTAETLRNMDDQTFMEKNLGAQVRRLAGVE